MKYRRLGCESTVSVLVEGQTTGARVDLDLTQIVSPPVNGQTSGILSCLGLESIVSASVDRQTSGTQVNSFGHILCKEDPCLAVLGTRESIHLFIVGIGPILNKEHKFIFRYDCSDRTCVYS